MIQRRMVKSCSFLVLILGISIGCQQKQDAETQLKKLHKKKAEIEVQIRALEKDMPEQKSNSKEKVVVVNTMLPKLFEYVVQTQGQVKSQTSTMLTARIPGIVSKVYVTEGDQVRKGQLLAKIDDAVMLRSMEEVKTGLDLATTVYEKQKNLWAQNIGTEIQFLRSKAEKESLENRLATLKEQLEMHQILAPESGVVEAVNVKEGEATPMMQPAFSIINTKNLKVAMAVSEAYISKIKKGNLVKVNIPEADYEEVSSVSFAGRTIDAMSRSFPVEASLKSTSTVGPNMTAVVQIVYQSIPNAICVSINVIQEINGEKVVFVAEKNNDHWMAKKRVVKVAGVMHHLAHITSGLKPEDKVITVGFRSLNDGDLIRLSSTQ